MAGEKDILQSIMKERIADRVIRSFICLEISLKILYTFFNENRGDFMPREMCFKRISERIGESKPGTVFVTSDFSDLATTYAANGVLRRLEKSGDIRQIMRGVYERPKYSKLLKEEVAPSADAVAHAIARNYGWTIVPLSAL